MENRKKKMYTTLEEMREKKQRGGMEGESETRTGWNGWRKEKDVYYAGRDEGRKKKGSSSGVKWPPGRNFAERRQALPPKAAGRERKGGKKAKSVYVLYAYFFLFFCASLQTQKVRVFCVYLYVYIKKKKVYM